MAINDEYMIQLWSIILVNDLSDHLNAGNKHVIVLVMLVNSVSTVNKHVKKQQ